MSPDPNEDAADKGRRAERQDHADRLFRPRRGGEEGPTELPPARELTEEDVRRIVGEHLVRELLAGAKIRRGSLPARCYGHGGQDAWIVTGIRESTHDPYPSRLGGEYLIAVCPRTGRIFWSGRIGE